MIYRKNLGCEHYIILCYPLISMYYQKYKRPSEQKRRRPGAGGQFLGPASRTSLSAWFLGTLAPPVSFSLFLLLYLSFSLLFTITSGWISTWSAEARQVYLLGLAVKTRMKGSLRRGTLRYSSGRRWPNVGGANSLSGILLAVRENQAIHHSSST